MCRVQNQLGKQYFVRTFVHLCKLVVKFSDLEAVRTMKRHILSELIQLGSRVVMAGWVLCFNYNDQFLN